MNEGFSHIFFSWGKNNIEGNISVRKENLLTYYCRQPLLGTIWGRSGRDHMVVGFTTTFAIGTYHH